MIPKIIHYVWVGGNPMPTVFQEYIANWKRIMPDYEFKEWNDETIRELLGDKIYEPILEWGYAERKHLGLLSDLIIYAALVEYGGFYVDTDVEIFKRFDIFLGYRNVFGYIFDALVGTAVIGAEKGSAIYKDLLNYILQMFEKEKQLTVSNVYVTQYLLDHVDGFLLNGKNRKYEELIIFTKDVFERYSANKDTGYAWHHCDGSWRKKSGGLISQLKSVAKAMMGKRFYYWIVHKYCMKKATFIARYKHDKKISNKNEFLIKNDKIVFDI